MTKTVLAIDPGRTKCGLALLSRDGEAEPNLIWRAIVPTEELPEAVGKARDMATVDFLVVGQGTTSKSLVPRLREAFPSLGILLVDETDTTLQARERYWQHHRRRGWRRLLPASMQVPPEPVDDFAALVLAERVLA